MELTHARLDEENDAAAKEPPTPIKRSPEGSNGLLRVLFALFFGTVALWVIAAIARAGRQRAAVVDPVVVILSDGRSMPQVAFGTGGRDKEAYRAGEAYPAVRDGVCLNPPACCVMSQNGCS